MRGIYRVEPVSIGRFEVYLDDPKQYRSHIATCGTYNKARKVADALNAKEKSRTSTNKQSTPCPQCYALRGHKWDCPVIS